MSSRWRDVCFEPQTKRARRSHKFAPDGRCTRCGVSRAPSKLHNRPTRGVDGKMKHSAGEAGRGAELALLERAGKIKNIKAQVCHDVATFSTPAVENLLAHLEQLIPPSAAGLTVTLMRAVYRSRQTICEYRADYEYDDLERGRHVIEDFKGRQDRLDPVYLLKKKLLHHVMEETVEEVYGNRRR